MKKILSTAAVLCAVILNQLAWAQCSRPVITSFSPITGFIGSNVTISGSDFDPVPGNNQVFFGATQATVLSGNSFSLLVKVPVGSTYAPISVKNACGLIGVATLPFNAIFCSTTLGTTSYNAATYTQSVSGGYQMLSQDIDLDGKPDLLVTGFTTNGVSVVRNLSTPGTVSFASPIYLGASSNTRCIATGDYDGDGKIDLAVAVNGFGIYIYRNTSTPGTISFASPTQYNSSTAGTAGTYQMAAGDFNNDGKLDLVYSDFSASIYTMRNTSTVGSISFSLNTVVNNTYATTGISVGDMNGDGSIDIVTSCPSNDKMSIIKNTTATSNTTFTFVAAEFFNTGSSYPYRAFVGDFDKDGKLDMIANNHSGATVSIFRNTGSSGSISMASPVNISTPTSNYRVVIGDVDGDGYPDIATKSSGENLFSVYKNTSSGAGNISFATRIDYAGQAEVSGIVVGDLDGDYVPDIATSGISYNQLRVYRNTSSITDTDDPTAICKNISVYLDQNGNASISANDIDNGSSDACGISSITLSKTNFTCADLGNNSVEMTVTDNFNNTDKCTATVNVIAIEPNGVTTFCNGGSVVLTALSGTSYSWSTSETTQSITVNQSGTYTVTVAGGGGCSQSITSSIVVTVLQTPSSFNVTGGGTVCGGVGGVHIGLDGSQTGVIYRLKLGSVYVTNINGTGSAIDFGTYTGNGTYVVEAVNVASGCGSAVTMQGSATLTAQDNPSISLTASASSICSGNTVQLTASGTNVSWIWTPGNSTNNSISVSPNSTQSYTVKATDNLGCFSEKSTTITVYPTPTVDAGQDDKYCTGGVTLQPTVTDASPAVQGSYPVLVYDANGGAGNGNFTASLCSDGYEFISNAVTSPTFSIANASNITSIQFQAYWTCGNGDWTILLNGVSVGTSGSLSNSQCTCNPPANTYPGTFSISGAQLNANWNVNGSNSISIVPNSPGSNAVAGFKAVVNYNNSPTYSWSPATDLTNSAIANPVATPPASTTYTLTYTSASGCAASDEVTITKQCCVAPALSCPGEITLSSPEGACGQEVTFEATATGTDPQISYSHNSGSFFGVGTTNVYAYVSNDCGFDTCMFQIKITDDEKPKITCASNQAQSTDAGLCKAAVAVSSPATSDNCGVASVSNDYNHTSDATDSYPVGSTTVTWMVTDVNGNTNSCTQIIKVTDDEKPKAVCKNYTLSLSSGAGSVVAADVDGGSTDNCGIASMSVSPNTFTCANAGDNTVTLTVTDVHGNTSSCDATVTVEYQPSCSIAVTPSNNTYTGGVATNIYLGYGPQSATLTVNTTGGSGFSYSWSPSTYLSSATAQSPVFTPTAEGNYSYTVTVTNSNGCKTTCKVSFCVKNVAVSGTSGNNSKVYLCHVPPGNSSNPQTLSISVNAVSSHLTQHSGDALGKCGSTCNSNKRDFSDEIIHEHGDLEISCFPNPFNNSFKVSYESISDEMATISVFSIAGVLLEKTQSSGYLQELELGKDLAAGVYLVTFNQGQTNRTFKVVKVQN